MDLGWVYDTSPDQDFHDLCNSYQELAEHELLLPENDLLPLGRDPSYPSPLGYDHDAIVRGVGSWAPPWEVSDSRSSHATLDATFPRRPLSINAGDRADSRPLPTAILSTYSSSHPDSFSRDRLCRSEAVWPQESTHSVWQTYPQPKFYESSPPYGGEQGYRLPRIPRRTPIGFASSTSTVSTHADTSSSRSKDHHSAEEECPICDTRISRSWDLKRHLLAHSKEQRVVPPALQDDTSSRKVGSGQQRVWSCGYCQACFIHNEDWALHVTKCTTKGRLEWSEARQIFGILRTHFSSAILGKPFSSVLSETSAVPVKAALSEILGALQTLETYPMLSVDKVVSALGEHGLIAQILLDVAPEDVPHVAQPPDERRQNRLRQPKMEGQYVCVECGQPFHRSGDLRKHAIRHDKVKLHACTVAGCTRSFAHPKDLQRHRSTHCEDSEKKRFPCRFCAQQYTRPYNLRRHLIRVHDIRSDEKIA